MGSKSDDAWWEERTLGEKIGLGILFGFLGLGLVALMPWALLLLWNWLMPELFGLKTVDYWQALGLLALSFLLFHRLGGGGSGEAKTERRRKKELKRYLRDEDGPGPEARPAGGTPSGATAES